MKPISTIASELRNSNPELGHPTARDLNNMLLVKGLICNVVDGKAPTTYGKRKGIQKKVSRDDMGRRFCYPVYNDQAEQYIKALAIEYFAPVVMPAVGPAAPVPTGTTNVDSPIYKYSRKDHDDAKNQYRDLLVFLEGPDSYWTYFQDARTVARIMGWSVYENRWNFPGIAFPKDQLSAVLQKLNRNQIGWLVKSPLDERQSIAHNIEPPAEDELSSVEIGSFVRVLINDAQEMSFFLRDSLTAPMIAHVTGTGMVISTDIQSFADRTVTTASAVGQALLGKRVGDIFVVPGQAGGSFRYQILEIK